MIKLDDISVLQNTKVVDFTSPEDYEHRIKTSEFTFAVSLSKFTYYKLLSKDNVKKVIFICFI